MSARQVISLLLLCSWTSIVAQAQAGEVPPVGTQPGTEETVIVLAMHGEPPNDYPGEELGEYFRLHAQVEMGRLQDPQQRRRYAELDARIRNWPRTAENDPFYVGSQAMADQLRKASGKQVIVGFNDFCGPSIDEALEQAASRRPEKVVVITPMMTPGGRHSELEIPVSVSRAQEIYPDIDISYIWPLDLSAIGQFLAVQIERATQPKH
jgi:sirohydrochlorin cobaltochelatase